MSATNAFDPNAAAAPGSGIFGLPSGDRAYDRSAKIAFLPIPWEVTTSYGGGTAQGPAAILEASHQVDLFDLDVFRPYEAGFAMRPLNDAGYRKILALNTKTKPLAERARKGRGKPADALKKKVNAAGTALNAWVHAETRAILAQKQIPALIGGDHSTPFGAFQAVAEGHGPFGILHFDAHSDTRASYEGFDWSHASIMRNALDRIPQITSLVQVGIRDFCEEEYEYTRSQPKRVHVHYDSALARAKQSGRSWNDLMAEILRPLPNSVWISFDIDGLDPRFCPHTGTPVPGGLDFSEATGLIGALARSGRKIVGFDLNEVAPAPSRKGQHGDEWDANVAARLLYKMAAWTLHSQGLRPLTARP